MKFIVRVWPIDGVCTEPADGFGCILPIPILHNITHARTRLVYPLSDVRLDENHLSNQPHATEIHHGMPSWTERAPIPPVSSTKSCSTRPPIFTVPAQACRSPGLVHPRLISPQLNGCSDPNGGTRGLRSHRAQPAREGTFVPQPCHRGSQARVVGCLDCQGDGHTPVC